MSAPYECIGGPLDGRRMNEGMGFAWPRGWYMLREGQFGTCYQWDEDAGYSELDHKKWLRRGVQLNGLSSSDRKESLS